MIIISTSIVTISAGLLVARMAIVEYLTAKHFEYLVYSATCCFEFQSYDSDDLFLVMFPILQFSASFGILFVACELPGRLSDRFDAINSQINKFNWYLFPLKMQQILPVVMIYAQQPVYLECFGSIPCDRETFKRVSYPY